MLDLQQRWVGALVKADVRTLDTILVDSYADTDESGSRFDKAVSLQRSSQNRNVDQPLKYVATWLIDEWSKIRLHVTQRGARRPLAPDASPTVRSGLCAGGEWIRTISSARADTDVRMWISASKQPSLLTSSAIGR
jgi:hypothetical protein